jgi:hypothetical protein
VISLRSIGAALRSFCVGPLETPPVILSVRTSLGRQAQPCVAQNSDLVKDVRAVSGRIEAEEPQKALGRLPAPLALVREPMPDN